MSSTKETKPMKAFYNGECPRHRGMISILWFFANNTDIQPGWKWHHFSCVSIETGEAIVILQVKSLQCQKSGGKRIPCFLSTRGRGSAKKMSLFGDFCCRIGIWSSAPRVTIAGVHANTTLKHYKSSSVNAAHQLPSSSQIAPPIICSAGSVPP